MMEQTFWRQVQGMLDALEVPDGNFRSWKNKNVIPGKYHLKIFALGNGNITAEQLMNPPKEQWRPW